MKPRGWQDRALAKFAEYREHCFLVEATPGSGKTIFSGFCAKHLYDEKQIDFSVIVVPTTAIKGGSHAGFLGDWHKVGIELTPVLKDGRGCPTEFRGGIITYQQLPNIASTIENWSQNGMRIFVVFDEIHHTTESNVWGAEAERLGRSATKVLAMSGTPFRGDGQRMLSYVHYDNEGRAISDHSYTYREAVRDNVCRQIEFFTDDGMAEWLCVEREQTIKNSVRISEASTEEEKRNVTRTIFRADSKWLERVIERADAKIDEYRTWDVDAGCLIVCRPGIDENDDRHLRSVANLVRRTTGEMPETICHDDPEANLKIERFRNGSQKFICAVRKISEGVDIKRLRILVVASAPTTELLFRQILGRILRVDNAQRPGSATAYIAKLPQLVEWAKRISEEAEAGLKEREDPKPRNSGNGTPDLFAPIGSNHEDGGAVSDFGDEFTAAEINAAERDKSEDPQLVDMAVTKIAYIKRKFGIAPELIQMPTDPLHVQKKKLRTDINKLVKTLAYKRDYEKPDFSGIWVALHRQTGARGIDDLMDNYSIDVMRQVENLLESWLINEHV